MVVLFFCFLVAGSAQGAGTKPFKRVSFTTEDGIIIEGKLALAQSAKKPTVLLLHGVGSVKEEWDAFAELLSKQGMGVFSYDARAHGKSTHTRSGKTISTDDFIRDADDKEWLKMVGDVGMALRVLEKNYGIKKQTLLLCGASIGANIALRYAADHPEISGVILLSPGLNYRGVTIPDILNRTGNCALFVAVSPNDQYAYQSVASMQRSFASQGKQALLTVHIETENQGHGVQMFKRWHHQQPSQLENNLVDWIKLQEKN